MWSWYATRIDELKPIDYVVANGDLIDGKQRRSGSAEARTADRNEQCRMAAACIDYCGARQAGLIHGTAYHDGQEEDWAHVVAAFMQTPTMFISGQEFFKLDGKIWDFKHKVGGSTIPHGEATAILRATLWNLIWHNRKGQQPKADYVVRSHRHSYISVWSSAMDAECFVTPALQGYGSKFGVREVDKTADIGFLYFDVFDNGDVQWQPVLANLESQTARVTSR